MAYTNVNYKWRPEHIHQAEVEQSISWVLDAHHDLVELNNLQSLNSYQEESKFTLTKFIKNQIRDFPEILERYGYLSRFK